MCQILAKDSTKTLIEIIILLRVVEQTCAQGWVGEEEKRAVLGQRLEVTAKSAGGPSGNGQS